MTAAAVTPDHGGRLTPPPAQTPDRLSNAEMAAISAATGRQQAAYHALARADGVAVFNPAQAFDAMLTADGFMVTTAAARWGLRLTGYGYGAHLTPVASAEIAVNDNRVELARGALTEWYVNGPFGLEQGFTLAAAPSLRADKAPLTLLFAQTGAGHGVVTANGRALSVALPGGGNLRYAGLVAYDARGVELPARMTAGADGQLRIEVQDQDAHYPVTIDPLIQHTKLTAPGAPTANTYTGDSVAMDSEVVVVGAPGYNGDVGAVFVFTRTVGSWQVATTPAAVLIASDGAAGDELGYAVALDGTRIIAGAPYHNSNAGAAYVFDRPGGAWVNATQTAKLTATGGAAGDYFGDAVAVSGNLAVVGAYGSDAPAADAGAAYVFTYNGAWAQTARLDSENVEAGGGFGEAVAVDAINNVVVVGAPYETVDLITAAAGKTYVFVGGNYADPVELEATQVTTATWLGYAVAVQGDNILAGAPQDNQGIGATYVFTRPTISTIEELYNIASLTPSDGASGDNFGSAIALSSDYAIVGSPTAVGTGGATSGAAYVFRRPAGTWTSSNEIAKLIPADGLANDNFGDAVDLAGATFVVGAPLNDDGAVDTGAAYVHTFDDLAVAKSSNVANALPGDAITYTLAYINNGPNVVNDAVIRDNLPVSLTNVAFVTAGPTVTATAGSRYLWDVAPIAVGAAGYITVSGVLSSPLAGGAIVNTVTITSPLPDRDTANNTSTVTVTVPLNADLGIRKTVTPARLTAGDAITITLVYSNAGPDSATGVVITDVLPAPITNPSFTSSGPTIQQIPASNLAWTVQGALAPNVTGIITVVGTINGALTAPEVFTNTAQIASALPDITPSNNSSAAPVEVCMNSLAVTANADNGAGTLRWAMAGICPGGVITINPGSPIVIGLTSGALVANYAMTINGAGPTNVTIDAANAVRGFDIVTGTTVAINGLTVQRGNAGAGEHGGGVRVNAGASLALSNTVIVSSTANTGGALANFGVTTIRNSVLRGNTGINGGAIGNGVGMTLTVTGSAIVSNTATGSLLSFGGGVFNAGAATLENVTLVGNRAAQGGVIYQQAQGAMTLRHVTAANNAATTVGGGVYGISGSVSLINSIFANNGTGAGANIGGAVTYTNSGGNLCWPSSTCSVTPAIAYADPLLGTLGVYLGAAPTLPLLPGSNAIDAVTAGCLAVDQRGVARPQGGACDSGAYEARNFTLALGSGNNQATPAGMAFAAGLRVTIAGVTPDPVVGGIVTYAGPLTGASTNPVTNTATVAGGGAVFTPTANNTLGAYVVAATARGATPTVSFNLTNTVAPITGLAATSSSPTILGASTTFTATVQTGSNISYTWSFGDGGAGAGATTTHQYAAVGLYTVIVTATNAISTASASTQVTVRDVPITGLQATNNGPKPQGSTFILTATTTAGTGITYAWSFGDGGAGSGATPTHIYANPGAYTAIVTATNTSGSTAAQTVVTVQGLVSLTVQVNGSGAVTKSPDAASYVVGTVVRLTAVPGVGQRFVGWSGDAAGATNPLNVTMSSNKTIVATFGSTTAPVAVNDGAATRQHRLVSGNVLRNDFDPNGGALRVTNSTPPGHGTATVAQNGDFSYTPALGFSGMDSFGYTIANPQGVTSNATVFIVVTVASGASDQPATVIASPTQTVTQVIATGGLTHTVVIPPNAYTGSMAVSDVFYIVYTPLPNPPETAAPPFGYMFGGKTFRLDAYLNGVKLIDPSFAPPIQLALHVDAAVLSLLDPAWLELFFWNGTGWGQDGIALLSRDLGAGRITFTLTHLGEFAYFEWTLTNSVYMPVIASGSARTTDATETGGATR